MSDRHIAIYNTHSDVAMIDDKMGALDNDGNSVTLDEDKIEKEMKRLDDEWNSQAYSRNRKAEYPSTGDQMDMIYKDNKNGTTTHADAVEAVKTKWPKDNSGPV